MSTDRSTKGKIFPRNLTARADYLVQGNPSSSRLESGVDNCYPGLEFDQRNLDKAFFPGLVFEFHRPDGAVIHKLIPGSIPEQLGLLQQDVQNSIFLWGVMGRTLLDQSVDDPPYFSTFSLSGLEAWRRIHDLLPGRIAILIGSSPSIGNPNLAGSGSLRQLLDQYRDQGQGSINRDADGNFDYAIFVSERADYLNDQGVVDIDAYEPGELTRSLCSPWQYDFRDCGCFYWAANKPDIVTNTDDGKQQRNFMRRDRTAPAPENILDDWARDNEYTYADLIEGKWNEMPIVLNDHESGVTLLPSYPDIDLLDRESVINELHYLATVEHALCVEYLYAHYSLNTPEKLSENHSELENRVFAAAQEVFQIAVDEMRHLRWVNEALHVFGEMPVLERATEIGRQLQKPFELSPLNALQLQWFIDVEEPSQQLGQGSSIDGMYTRLLTSIVQQPELFPEQQRLVHLFKLIIDEGDDHFSRFGSIKRHLEGLNEVDYLRELGDATTGSRFGELQQLNDTNYEILIGSLSIAFSFGDQTDGTLLKQAHRAMVNMHETAHYLASNNIQTRFLLPDVIPEATDNTNEALDRIERMGNIVTFSLDRVIDIGNSIEREMAKRQKKINDDLFSKMKKLIK